MRKITVVTCTGGRPELFALCRRWVTRQSLQPTRWIVTTDLGDQPLAPEAEVVQIPSSYEAPKSIRPSAALRAITFAMRQVKDDSDVVVMEDDDWYGPRYIETLLSSPNWCSHPRWLYQFHLPSQRYSYVDHLEPCEGVLAFKAGNLSRIQHWLTDRPTLDSDPMEMGGHAQIKGVGFGLPGRSGQTHKHVPGHRKVKMMDPDHGHAKFRSIVGDDADAYLSLLVKP